MAFSEMPSQPRMLLEKLIGRNAFEKLERLTNAYIWRDFHKKMDMIRHYLKLIDFKRIFLRYFAQKLFAVFANDLKLKRVFGILWLPNQMICVLTYTMVKIV